MDGIEQILPLLLVLLCRPEGSHGQLRQSFKRLQRGLGKWVVEADDLECPDQFLIPEQGQVSNGPDSAYHVNVGVIFAGQLAGGVDCGARRFQQGSEERCAGRDCRVGHRNLVGYAEGGPEGAFCM